MQKLLYFFQNHVHDIAIFIMAFVLVHWNCKKPSVIPIPTEQVKEKTYLIDSISYGSNPVDDKKYIYNADGDLLYYNFLSDTFSYVYYKDSIVKYYGIYSQKNPPSACYYINTFGKADSCVMRDEDGKIMNTDLFVYDQDGYLTEVREHDHLSGNSYRTTMVYQNGDLTQINEHNFKDVVHLKYFYQYDEDQKNILNLNLHHPLEHLLTKERLGRTNAHLIKSIISTSAEGDTLSFVKFTHEWDENKKILKQKIEDILYENTIHRTLYLKRASGIREE